MALQKLSLPFNLLSKTAKMVTNVFHQKPSSHDLSYPGVKECPLQNRENHTLVCDMETTLLRSDNLFPYFMLVAFEGGSIFRAFFLLLISPLLWVLSFESGMMIMMFITFCGLRLKDMNVVGRAVLPKFYLENLNFQVYKVLKFSSGGCKVVFTSFPRVMVEGFLKEYLSVDFVKGTEMHTFGQYYTGFVSSSSGVLVKLKAFRDFFAGKKQPDLGIGGSDIQDHPWLSFCKEAYVVKKEDRTSEDTLMQRKDYPKPLVFHDGRLAFMPTPGATLFMFLWLPLGIPLAAIRFFISVLLPPRTAEFFLKLTGVIHRFEVSPSRNNSRKGVLYVCNHRTLLDPLVLNAALSCRRPLTALSYSVSRFSELVAPIKTVRLTRDRKTDAETIKKLLTEGDLILCPEGTTCREPYLLRFSALFAELTDEIVPVAINTRPTMFYGTTASGFKCLDAIFIALNPRPYYSLKVFDKVPKEQTMGGGKTSFEVANYIQRQIADALGFECTSLTRKDKYMMLAGNDGVVQQRKNNS